MNLPDFINGVFETGIGLVAILNLRAIRRDKKISGVHWGVTGWASAWGLYNMYYYPHLGQWWSFTGGLLIASINWTWLAHVWYYARSKGKSQ